MVRECNLLRDFLNKVDISNQEKVSEIERAEKENELAYSRFNSLKKQQSQMITELKLMKDENVKLVNEIRVSGNKQSMLEEEVKMKAEMIEQESVQLLTIAHETQTTTSLMQTSKETSFYTQNSCQKPKPKSLNCAESTNR